MDGLLTSNHSRPLTREQVCFYILITKKLSWDTREGGGVSGRGIPRTSGDISEEIPTWSAETEKINNKI